MTRHAAIPTFTLFGETGSFPDVVHCERIADRAPVHGWRISPHRHAHMGQMFLVTSGHAKARIDDEQVALDPGRFLYVPARTVHGFAFQPGTEGYVLSFPQAVIDSIQPGSADLAQVLSNWQLGDLSAFFERLVQSFVQAFASAGSQRSQVLVGLAHAVLSAAAETVQTTATKNASPASAGRLQDLDQLIAANMDKGWRPADYASALSITTGQLSRICRDRSGMGATAYLETRVMTEACRLLAFTQMPVSEVGYRLGYQDPSHFSRRFRKFQGEPPKSYRRRFAQ